MNSHRNNSWSLTPVWLGLVGLAVALRAYHLPGFVVNNDEGHWLLYTLHKQLLFESVRNSYPRPDILFPLLATVPLKLLGPNELALRLWPMLIGSLTLLPLAAFVFQLTASRVASVFAAAFLAVLPLHVYYSAQGIPDSIALFLGLCALEFLLRARQTKELTNFIWMGICLALALLTKATALYFWGFLAVAGPFLFGDRRSRLVFYATLVLSALPLALVALVICQRNQTLSFFREPGVTGLFGFSLVKVSRQLWYFARFYDVLLPVAVVGAVLVVFRATKGSSTDRQLLIWLLPLANLAVAPFFRVGLVELLWLVPTVCLFAAVALNSFRPQWAWSTAGIVVVVLLARSLFGVPLPYPGRARAATAYSTAVLDRPAGWPSREAARWLLAHTSPVDAILFTAYTFTDPLLLELSASRRVIPNGGENWDRLRDSANRIKYVVFTQDYRAYAESLARYADTHFTLPAEAQFPNYAIYDCQKDGRFVAYADAYSGGSPYLEQGVEFLQRQELQNAVEAFKKVLEINPAQPVACKNLAVLDYQLGRDADGLAQVEHNIRLGIELGVSYGVLGQIRERQGDLAAAQAAYEKSLAMDPQDPVTRQLLASLKSRLHARKK